MRQKGLFHTFYPDQWVDSTYMIDFEALYQEGYRGLIFDIDNTLVHHGAPADEKAVHLFEKLRELGFACCLLSNNQLPRVKPFADVVRMLTSLLPRIIWRPAAGWAPAWRIPYL